MSSAHTLRISANNGAHYFDVLFFERLADAVAEAAGHGCHIEFNALTIGRVYDSPPATGSLGKLLFVADNFAPSIIQHELLHAAMIYERNVFGNPGLSFAEIEAEERLAHTQQDLLDSLLFAMDEAGLHEFGMAPASTP